MTGFKRSGKISCSDVRSGDIVFLGRKYWRLSLAGTKHNGDMLGSGLFARRQYPDHSATGGKVVRSQYDIRHQNSGMGYEWFTRQTS